MTTRELVVKLVAIVATFIRNWKNVIIGQGIYQTLSWMYDNPLWMAIEAAFGVRGVAGMMVGAMIINFCVLFYYRSKRVSWLGWDKGIELIPIINKMKGRFLREAAIFLFLSVTQDSFITTAYMRHGREDGLKVKDFVIFFASSLISICYWAVRNGIIVETARSLLKF